jgi:ribose transport system permease protein
MTDVTTTPADEPEVEAEEAVREIPFWQRLVSGSATWVGLILVGLIVVFSLLEPSSFLDTDNFRNIATDAAVLLVLSTGMTYVIITAGIDLSVGAVLVFSGVVSAKAMNATGGNDWAVIFLGLVVALAAGFGWGVINGFLVAKGRIPAAHRHARDARHVAGRGARHHRRGRRARGAVQAHHDDRDRPRVRPDPVAGDHRLRGRARVRGDPGRHPLRPLHLRRRLQPGGRAPRGHPVDLHLIKVYALTGTLSGLAGFLSLARFSTTTIGAHDTDNLQAIAAVVIGGTSLFGGIGTMLGTVFGVFIPAVLNNGFIIVGVQVFWQQIAVGAVLIGAVYLDQLRRRSQDQR